MSDYASTLERTRHLFARASRLEAAAAAHPKDRALQIDLQAVRRLAAKYQEQLYARAAQERTEVCEYKIIDAPNDDYKVANFARSILRFQDILTGIFDAKMFGPKRKAKYSRAIRNKTALSLAYTFPGSLGVVLTVPNERNLFDGEFDQVVDTFQEVLAIRDTDDVRDIARTLGTSVVRLIYDWADANLNADFAVDVKWRRTDGRQSGGAVDTNEFGKIVEIIGRAKDTAHRQIEINGLLVGLNTTKSQFQLKAFGGETYSGVLASDFDRVRMYTINAQHRALIMEESIVTYATESEQKRYILHWLSPEVD